MFIDKSQVTTNTDLVNIHALIKPLFSKEMLTKAVNIPPAGRISPFLVNWQKLTSNQDILLVIKVTIYHSSSYLFNKKSHILRKSTRTKLLSRI